MIDWHSHILPGMDDGSRDTAESIALLNMQAQQGIQLAIATPHFYANDETVEAFLERRQKAYEELKPYLSKETPQILLGAEVRYYPGISRMENLKKLCIQGSQLLLLEMPMCRWTEYMVRELLEMANMGNIRFLLAHIERYLPMQSEKIWDQLLERGMLMQVNASFFFSFGTKRKAIAMLRKGKIHAIGSDCHGVTFRAPEIEKAFQYIRKKRSDEYLVELNEFGQELLGLTDTPA